MNFTAIAGTLKGVMHRHYNVNVLISFQVQPVAELSELSRRGSCDGRQVELAPANIRGGTLRRSGSLRFHQNTVSLSPFPIELSVQSLNATSRVCRKSLEKNKIK